MTSGFIARLAIGRRRIRSNELVGMLIVATFGSFSLSSGGYAHHQIHLAAAQASAMAVSSEKKITFTPASFGCPWTK